MRKNITLTTLLFILLSYYSYSQVGIGTTTPDASAMLDITSTDGGFLMPRVSLTGTGDTSTITGAEATGLLVYNDGTGGLTPAGFYYWTGSEWRSLTGQNSSDWALGGNTGTTYGVDYIGTNDATDLAIARNGVTKLRVENTTTTFANELRTRDGGTDSGDVLVNIYDSADDGVIDVYENNAYNHRIHGNGATEFNAQQLALDFRISSDNLLDAFFIDGANDAVHIRTASPYGPTDQFSSTAATDGYAVNGYTTGTGWGVYGENLSATGGGMGVVGVTMDTDDGTGIAGVSDGTTLVSSLAGFATGVVGNGAEMGVYGQAMNGSGERYGGYFHGGPLGAGTPVAQLAADDTFDLFGGYFSGEQTAGDYAWVGINTGGTDYKILGGGTVSTMVKDDNNKNRILFCPEAPEILFQDYGTGRLTNGEAYINIDPVLAKNIYVDQKHPLKVFVQLEGDCNGVFVTEKTKNGFRVKELKGGTSNISFSWQIVASRADSQSNGTLSSKHVGVRLPIGPEKKSIKKAKRAGRSKK